MSLKRTAILLAVSHANQQQSTNNTAWNSLASGNINSQYNATDFYTATNFNHSNKNFNNQGLRVMRPGVGGFHGNVNILLGGAMLTVVTTIVCLICYCCHRKIKMRSSTSSLYRQQRWLDNDPNMEIYSVEQYFDTSGLYTENDNLPAITLHNEPPPSYDCVMALDEVISRKRKNLYTFKGYHNYNHHHRHQHHPGFDIKDCMGNNLTTPTSTTTTPQVSLDETNDDMLSPSSVTSLCNCSCPINQHFTTTLCTNCSNVIGSADNVNSNAVACLEALITARNMELDNCPLNERNPMSTEIDLLNDQLNNNDCSGNSCHLDSVSSPSTSTSTHYVACSVPLSVERLQSQHEVEDENRTCEIDRNGNCRQHENVDLNTINRNGLIRLDMRQIIDQTGLPSYETALKLKSSGYV
ncbi:CLUMA_CG009719, isoform A [Clunio marinus]|uniref:CLUMA_CG009719, isoform A n=1 Tax=Clunio marinus TaxID=568069 RepID=A0A1J1I9Q0_9DIPT|nr:CLUMA_CG009719, isoform A [Clunio marinus]